MTRQRIATQIETRPRVVQISVRLDGPILSRVDAEQERLAREVPFFKPSRSDAVRSLLTREGPPAPPPAAAVKRAPRAPKGASVEGVVLGGGGPVAVKGEC